MHYLIYFYLRILFRSTKAAITFIGVISTLLF